MFFNNSKKLFQVGWNWLLEDDIAQRQCQYPIDAKQHWPTHISKLSIVQLARKSLLNEREQDCMLLECPPTPQRLKPIIDSYSFQSTFIQVTKFMNN